MVIYTWWCWHINEGGGVWAVESSTGFRHFRENKMPIFHYAEGWKRRRSRGGGRRYFASDRCWSRRRQTLALRLSAYPRRGQQRRRRWTCERSCARHAQCSAAWRSARASDAEPHLSIDRQTRLSRLNGARERSGPRLSRDRHWSSLASDASNARSRPLVFERGVDTWRCLRATDARVASVGLAIDMSVAPEISLVNC
jgi:hypothetical protein